jgi:hypothetical protein
MNFVFLKDDNNNAVIEILGSHDAQAAFFARLVKNLL